MALTSGTRLGVYEITAQIGEGGMGAVYRATDTSLGRQVAIKVLPDAFAQDTERLARFEREAKTLAALNNPNIAAIYGLERSSGTLALVMELVEGEDLSQRIARGPIPLDEALPIAKQIAEALEAAHEQGIIHRDLKPANIKVRDDGTVKVLDFGLAKAMEPATGSSPRLSMSPTITTPAMTQAGMILGTAAYMSPEQAKGRAADRRSDVWAFGAVLYEMLTGRRAFAGEDVSDTMASVLKADTNWSALPPSVPPHVAVAIKRCLRRDPRERIHDVADLRLALEGAFETTAPPAPRSGRTLPWAVASGLALLAVVALGMAWRATRPVASALRPLVRLDVDLGPDVSLGSALGPDAVLSPDGTRLVYVSNGRLFTRRLDEPTATGLAGPEGAYAPFFSPDGQWIAFFTANNLQKISMAGGAAVVVSPVRNGRGGSWGADGDIIVASPLEGLLRIPSAGGPPTSVLKLPPGEYLYWPQVLPGGKAVLFTAVTGANTATIDVLSLADHRTSTLVRGGAFGRYLPSGHLVYVNGGTLFAVPFDVDRLDVQGTPVPVLDQVRYGTTVNWSAQLDVSDTGTLIYRSGGAGAGSTVAWLDGAGQAQPLLAKPGVYGRPSLSPDGQRLALEVTGASGTDIWIDDWPRDTMTRLTFTGKAQAPVWSPDGQYLAFRVLSGGMAVIRADGAGQPQPVTHSTKVQFPWSFTPDGTRLAFLEQGSGGYDLWTVPVEHDGAGVRGGKPVVFLQTPADERAPSISPDGRWLAYASDASGTSEVYVRAFPDTGGTWQVSTGGGTYPMWSRTGHQLFFESLDNTIKVSAYTVKGEAFVADTPRVWSAQPLAGDVNNVKNVDLARDGKRLVALMPVTSGAGAQNQVTFLQNFFDEVRRKVPTGH